MDIFDILQLIGGLALFLFGMNVMGDALEKKAGGRLKTVLGKMTDSKLKGFGLGLGVTSVIQSSSATTVMVVGFVNSGIMTLKQAISIIMGANIGTTVTAWLLSLTGIQGDSLFVNLLKPSSFTPILAIVGIAFIMLSQKSKRKDTGTILLGFAVLMAGMDSMSAAVAGLKDVPEFTQILTLFSNPILGVLAGAVLTAVIQSSSASVGILQAISSTGAVTYSSAIPIIMGQNIGTCVTAMISSIGANKNARRTAIVHLYFNLIGTAILLMLYYVLNSILDFSFSGSQIDEVGIAVVHSCFNILTTALLFPFTGLLEKMACATIKDSKETEEYTILDKRLLGTPAIALERCKKVITVMADITTTGLLNSFDVLKSYNEKMAECIRKDEDKVDKYEDKLGAYLVELSAGNLTCKDSANAADMLRIIGDIERISDHSVNILESAEEMYEKKISFSEDAKRDLKVIIGAVQETVELAMLAFTNEDAVLAGKVEPLEQVVDDLQAELKKRHVARLQRGECTIELGFVLQDILTNLERVSDHSSNIAGYVKEMSRETMSIHSLQKEERAGSDYEEMYQEYSLKYMLAD